ncbi:MAG: sugar ABC transporter permease [Anaerolineales bacterium]|nr:sugar ABC transporter permease [Anaerolineales bacterium]
MTRPSRRHALTPYLFLLPGFAFLAMWMLYPMGKALWISFFDWSPIPGADNPFVGLTHYAAVLQDDLFWLSLKNTASYALVTVLGQLVLGLLVALLLDRITTGKVFFRTAYYLPVVTSWVVASLLFRYLFNGSEAGLVNYLLVDLLHLLPEHVAWLNEPGTAFVVIDTLGIWKGIGWTMVIFLAALQAIPVEYYDAAAMDGASRAQATRCITLPLLLPTIALVVIMLTIGAFAYSSYIPVDLITGGGPMHRTDVLLSYLYYHAFDRVDFGYAGAVSYLLILLVFAVSQVQLRLLRIDTATSQKAAA